jgi:hypothetical protein
MPPVAVIDGLLSDGINNKVSAVADIPLKVPLDAMLFAVPVVLNLVTCV